MFSQLECPKCLFFLHIKLPFENADFGKKTNIKSRSDFFHFYQNKKIWSIYNTIQSEIHIKLLDPYIEKKIKFSHERASYKRQKKNKIILIKLKNKKYPISIVNIILI